MSRKVARELAFKIVFESEFQKDEASNKLIEMFLENPEEDAKNTSEEIEYIKDVVEGVCEKLEELDAEIKKHLKGWTMDRIGKIDIAILRLAIYEILYREDIPYKVSANEAVELAKTFSEDASPSFINGVLAEIINER